jgi:hypothetical protein
MRIRTRRVQVILGTLSTELVTARRADSLLSSLITDTADQDILTAFAILLQDQIGMVSDLTHLHDKTEDVGIIVEKDTLSDIGLELAGTTVHDAACEIILLLTKELSINVDLLGWKLHRRGMITLDTTKHEAISEDSKLLESFSSRSFVAEFLDRVEKFLIENRDMLHAAVLATSALAILVHVPIESRTWALLAEVARKWLDVEEANERKELADPVLKWSTGQAPFVVSFQSKAGFG